MTALQLAGRLLFRTGLLVVILSFLGVLAALGSVVMTPFCSTLPGSARYDLGVVLSAGMTTPTDPDPATRARTLAGIAAFQEGHVTRLHMTGNVTDADATSAAAAMATLARDSGVPDAAITTETKSRSTLENALFSKPVTGQADSVLLITSGFHMWRSRASMAWAGTPVDGTCQSSAYDYPTRAKRLESLFMEGPKWVLNTGRAGLWSAANAASLEARLPDWLLH